MEFMGEWLRDKTQCPEVTSILNSTWKKTRGSPQSPDIHTIFFVLIIIDKARAKVLYWHTAIYM
jgi:hypothetical protein